MLFEDYDQILKTKKSYLIDSYVDQYGEKYRSSASNNYDKIGFCFFVNSRRIEEYIEMESIKLSLQLTFYVLESLGIDTAGLEFSKERKLISSNRRVQNILEAFFPGKGYVSYSNIKDGIFSFAKKYDENDTNNLAKRSEVLHQLGLIKRTTDIRAFSKTELYKEADDAIRVLIKHIMEQIRELDGKFTNLEEYSRTLMEQENIVIEKAEKECIHLCKQFIDGSVDIRNSSSELFCSSNEVQKSKVLPLSPGLLEYFLPDYTEQLLSADKNDLQKEQILQKRCEYLQLIGVNKDQLGISDEILYGTDWYQIPQLREKLPNIEMLKNIKGIREKFQNECMLNLSKLYILNDYKLDPNNLNDYVKEMLYFGSSRNGYHCSHELAMLDDATVFICPKDAYTDVLDFIVDHEVRHALEHSSKHVVMSGEVPFLKKGTILEEVKTGVATTFYIEKQMIGECNRNIDEVMSQKLTLESTKKRYAKGKYIFIPPDKARMMSTSYYDSFIENFDIVFSPEMQQKLLQSRMLSNTQLPMYDSISQETYTTINRLILDNSKEAKRNLYEIREEIDQKMIEDDFAIGRAVRF